MERKMIHEIDGVRVTVMLQTSADCLTWSFVKASIRETRQLNFRQIISARVSSRESETVLHVHYVAVVVGKARNVVLRHATASFFATDVICTEMSEGINKCIRDTQTHRPRRLLVFVNPMSGSQESVTSYNYSVKPLFDLADVTVDCVVTSQAHHPAEVLADYDLSTIDGVISMGGDGSNGHVFNALMQKTMKDAGLDITDEPARPITPRVTFGVLPSGSGGVMARSAFLCHDLETAALSIILGQKALTDAGVVRHKGKFHAYLLFLAMSGCYGSTFVALESLRWLKTARYTFFLATLWWLFSLFDVEIDYLPTQENRQLESPPDHDKDNSNSSTADGPMPGWKTFRGKASSVIIMNTHIMKFFTWDKIPSYNRPEMSSGSFDMIVDKVKTFWEMVKLYIYISRNGDRSLLPPEKSEMFRVSEVDVRITTDDPSRASLTLEAEPYEVLDYGIKLYEKVFETFVIDHALVSDTLDYTSQDRQ